LRRGRGGKEEERGREEGERGGEALAVEPSHFSTGSDATVYWRYVPYVKPQTV